MGRGIRQTKSVYTLGSANPKVYTLSACQKNRRKFLGQSVNLHPLNHALRRTVPEAILNTAASSLHSES